LKDRLHEIMAQCVVIHEVNLNTGIINNIDLIEEKLSSVAADVKEHYLMLLLQYYFQNNNLDCAQQLLLQGIKFDMTFRDIKEAFIHINDDEDNVIEFFEDNVVMLKDIIQDEDLLEIYEYYNENTFFQPFLEEPMLLIRRNRYVCAHAYKNDKNEYSNFFINEDLLASLMRDMPFLLK